MPIISEAASALRSRFGFHQPSESDAVRSSPAVPRSASRGNLFDSHSKMNTDRAEDRGALQRSSTQTYELEEDPNFWKNHNIQVIIRVRPLSNSEISHQGNNKCVRQDSCQTITWIGHPESRFTFDLIADESVTQEKLFKVAGLPMVENCMGGYNSCMFAYGQTGSGKTHTMLGDIEGGTRRHSVNCGMTPRVFEHLFSRIQKEKESRKEEKLRFTCKCSFLEIYNEQILDLLDPSSVNLQLREDAKKGVYVENLKEMEVTSPRDVIQQLLEGAANRKVAATNMNLASSRSHSVFTCNIESQWESQGVIHHRFARLNLVDLAGSERQKSSGAEGERLKEATNINKSLSTLGLVIMNLVNISNGKSQHVPYRDSKLTFLLQDSLGGNSKTTIIANISPSTCCSLETLSTLKFAQRAKFIKNNAIVNEDASGDVLTMRLQIQQLKKEVSRLRGLVDGETENQENDSCVVSFPGSPGPFKWDGLNGSFSPLASGRRISQVQKKEFETALVGAFRRERDKEISLKSLTAENEAAMHLAKQREDEIQSLKLRLRFREAGIKRLEGVAAGKLSAEGHLLQEREEHLKEIEVLRNQLDRNQEVTRFAMENLRLKEEIRRLKSFYEEGERERMNEQIMVLQNKLLEALDWKLMHESDPGALQKGSSDLENLEDSLLTSNKELKPTGISSIEVENEFLRLQAIQNQNEMETLHRKFNACLEEKEILDRHVKDLVMELDEEKRLAENIKEEVKQQVQLDLQTNSGIRNHLSDAAVSDPKELKTMVDAIAVASQREAEAHEAAINLAKESEELRAKIKLLIEDNSKLLELYEAAVVEASTSKDSKEGEVVSHSNELIEFPNEADTDRTTKINKPEHQHQEMHAKDGVDRTIKIEQLEQQLEDLHEENEKLMALYEKAMQERDDYKRMFSFSGQHNAEVKELDCVEKFVEVDNNEKLKFDRLSLESDDVKMSTEQILSTDIHESGVCIEDPPTDGKGQIDVQATVGVSTETFDQIEVQPDVAYDENSDTESRPSNFPTLEVPEQLNLARNKLEKVNDKLVKATKDLTFFGTLEKVIIEVDALSKQIEVAEKGVAVKQQELVDLTSLSLNMEKQKHIVDNKLSAMKSSISCIASSVFYWEEREARKRKNVMSTSKYVEQKREKLTNLQYQMDENEAAQQTAQRCAVDLRNTLACLKSKLEEENRKKESEKVLFTKENLDTTNIPIQLLGSKATDLLKSEEERIKLHTEMKQTKERLNIMLKETERLMMESEKLKTEMQTTEGELSIALQSMKEMEFAHQDANEEKVMISEMIEDGRKEVEKLIVEYSGCVSGLYLKLGEIKILEEELQVERESLEKLRDGIVAATRKELQILEDARCSLMATNEHSQNWCVSEMMEAELQEISLDLLAVKSLLASNGLC